MTSIDSPVNDKPYRIQTTAGHRKYLVLRFIYAVSHNRAFGY